jgi:hypothetical protein
MFRQVLRYLLLLAACGWLGGLLFFGVVAYTAFTVLPSTHEAGLVVGASLRHLHVFGMACGVVMLVALLVIGSRGRPRAWLVSVFLTGLMLGLTGGSQWIILPWMERERAAIAAQTSEADIASVPMNNPHRAAFDWLHGYSTWVEDGVLFCGLVVLGCIALDPVRKADAGFSATS